MADPAVFFLVSGKSKKVRILQQSFDLPCHHLLRGMMTVLQRNFLVKGGAEDCNH